MVSGRSRSFVSRFSKYILTFLTFLQKTVYRLAGAYPGNSVGRGELRK